MTKHTATIEFPKEFIIDIASYAMSDPMWIDEVEIEGERKGEYISEHIANGGTILIHDNPRSFFCIYIASLLTNHI